jgi:hypothetical protein
VFDAAKALGENAVKMSKEHLIILEKLLHPICTKNIDVPNLLKDIVAKLTRKSENFFADINESFRVKNFGPDSWKSISSSPGSMKAFSIDNGFTDPVPDNVYWGTWIQSWNLVHPEKPPVTSISAIQLSSTLTLKALRTLS